MTDPMPLFLRFAALSDVGRVRKDNQDSGYVGPNLLVIADGVGGAARGDIASSAAVEAMRKLDVPPGNDALSALAATIHLAHDRLAEIVEQHPDLDGTSTTVSAAIFDGTHLRIGHVGDSRGYLLRDGVLQQLTSDHTLVQSLVDEGRITEEEARVHPHRNLILRAVDGVHEPEPDLFSVPLGVGDRLLFCSDGCSGVLDDATMAALLGADPLEEACARLVTGALDAGSSDNVTVVIAEVVTGDQPPAGEPIVVGAAATAPHLRIADDAPTGRLSATDVATLKKASTRIDPEAIRYAPQPPPRGRWLGRVVALVLVLGVIAAAGYGAYRYSQTRWFVAEDNGVVTIYKGVNLDIPIIDLHSSGEPTAYVIGDMGTFADDVRDGKDFSSEAKARVFVYNAACRDTEPRTIVLLKPDPKVLLDRLLRPVIPVRSTGKVATVSGASCSEAP
ncbi:MAG: PP2C family protein-serine/threonine phosphatase [Marmoricola sp.]